jgi:hypothetical protein
MPGHLAAGLGTSGVPSLPTFSLSNQVTLAAQGSTATANVPVLSLYQILASIIGAPGAYQ